MPEEKVESNTEHKEDGGIKIPKRTFFVVLGFIIVIAIGFLFGRITANPTGSAANPPQLTGSKFGYAAGNDNVGLAVGNLAPDFNLISVENGKQISRDSLRGKPTLIHFFASWCPRCSYTGRNVAQFDDDSGGNVFNVLLVSIDPRVSDSAILDFKKRIGRDDWIVTKYNEAAINTYKVQYLDTKYLLDKTGIIKYTDVQTWDYNEAKTYIGALT